MKEGEGNDKGQNPNDKAMTKDWNDGRATVGSDETAEQEWDRMARM
jgi:hypothetical protein